ncbi:MAG: diguanylate cyclase [Granulosicoccaceae bacterium]|jgi:diguanylate cyclase (GGDEF)-like protein
MYIVLDYLSWLGIIAHSLFIPLFFWLDVAPLALFNVISVSAWITAKRLNRSGQHYIAILLLTGEVIVHAVLAVYFLGWDSGFHYYLVPLLTFIYFNHKQQATMITAEAVALLALYIALYIFTSGMDYSALRMDVLQILNYINIAVNFTALGMLGYYFRVASFTAEAKMERLASIDTLTRLFNRRKMRELIEVERARNKRSGEPFLLVLGDIDHFKRFNDSYGHDCGDYVLQQVSKLMTNSLRDQDVVARWGGEEFLIMLPDTELAGGLQAVEKLRKTIEQTRYSFADNTFSVTMTFGVAAYDPGKYIDANIKAADEALYEGKRAGRNRVVAAS